MKFTWFEVTPGLALPETLHLYQGTRDRLGLQLLLHVGSWLAPGASRGWVGRNHLGNLATSLAITWQPVTEASTQ